MLKLETTIPFQGFYESIHDDVINSVVELESDFLMYNEDYRLEEAQEWVNSIDYRAIFPIYAKEYAKIFAEQMDLKTLEFIELKSPKEYNFSTDIIICNIAFDELEIVFKEVMEIKEDFEVLIRNRFTSRDGFISFYSNDIDEWLEKPLSEWDLNEVGALLEVYAERYSFSETDTIDYKLSELVYENLPDYEPNNPCSGR